MGAQCWSVPPKWKMGGRFWGTSGPEPGPRKAQTRSQKDSSAAQADSALDRPSEIRDDAVLTAMHSPISSPVNLSERNSSDHPEIAEILLG